MNYVGIDLGTTNSAICSYNGETVRLYKSPDQHDVTPSAIFFDKRGKYVGSRAYASAARSPERAAVKFKRFMGTNTPIDLSAVPRTMTPEECSAEILRTLFGYLPEEIRNSDEVGTVITVPAAFNQMQKDATTTAATLAQIGQVALMQEPVAAVMSVMRQRKQDGLFCIYDLGGGTLDIAVAQSTAGRVSLLAGGGIAMCGGADFDRQIFDAIVKPWLFHTFSLPDEFDRQSRYKPLARMALWASEKAKIELSQREDSLISLSETELNLTDENGRELYVDIPFKRQEFDELIVPKILDSIEAARTTLRKAGYEPQDVERMIFVGGPTQYKPLRDKISSELGIAASSEINPMTAVAEGAAIFAESIDWSTTNRERKKSRGTITIGGPVSVSFVYTSRTPDLKAKILAKVSGTIALGTEFQIDCLDNGWSSGRLPLRDGASVDVVLSRPGENSFKVYVLDAAGSPLTLDTSHLMISRTAATVDAIPASHSIGVAAKDKIGGAVGLIYLIQEGEPLPKKGALSFRAETSLKAGTADSINFKLWEGDCKDPITDNRFIGLFKITGQDFSDGAISAGAELHCEYEILDSGQIILGVSVPSISGSFQNSRNFYSRQEGQIDYSKAAKLLQEQASQVQDRLDEMVSKVDDPRLTEVQERLSRAETAVGMMDPETTKQALDDVQQLKRLLAETRQTHLKTIRQLELDKAVTFFQKHVRPHARPSEISTFENLVKTAESVIMRSSSTFESHLDELRGKNFLILWRQDWFVIDRFKMFAEAVHLYPDCQEHAQLVAAGTEALRASDMEKVRHIVAQLEGARIGTAADDDMVAPTNIVLG